MAKFSSKEKIRAVRRYLEGTEGGKVIVKSICINVSVLYQWIKRYESLGEKAFERLTDEDTLLIHYDQGWHYQMKQYRHSLNKCGITQSMFCKGNCYDNAVIESFFGIVKSELFYLKELKQNFLGISPVQYRTHAQKVA